MLSEREIQYTLQWGYAGLFAGVLAYHEGAGEPEWPEGALEEEWSWETVYRVGVNHGWRYVKEIIAQVEEQTGREQNALSMGVAMELEPVFSQALAQLEQGLRRA